MTIRLALCATLSCGLALAEFPSPQAALAQAADGVPFELACPGLASLTGRCASLLAESQGELIHYPGLIRSHIEACFDAGYETWFSGVTENGLGYSGSFAGDILALSWRGGPVSLGTCADLAVWGDGFVIRPASR